MSPVASIENAAVDQLKRKDHRGALLWLLINGSAAGVPILSKVHRKDDLSNRILNGISRLIDKAAPSPSETPIPLHAGFEVALQASRPRGYADYLYHRFANPSLIGAVPPLLVFGGESLRKKRRRVIDLLCGVGHTTALLSSIYPALEVIAADSDFVNLFLIRNFIASGSSTICIDAELPLPFADSSCDGLFCLDGLHYIRSKAGLMREVDRIVDKNGVWLFAHMHNAKRRNENPGCPLDVDGYADRFAFGQQRIVSEAEIIQQFSTCGSLDLRVQHDMETLKASNALTLMGARTGSLWEQHSGLDDALCRSPNQLGFNPLYQIEECADGLILKPRWPSDTLRSECESDAPRFSDSIRLRHCVVEEVNTVNAGGVLTENVRSLLRSFVLVNLPACYPRTGLDK
jgi:SAM-dependent methyltransferase